MQSAGTVFLFDVDNTLLDNDRVTDDLKQHLESVVGPEKSLHYWDLFDELRSELGYADYLGALQRYRVAYPHDTHLLAVSYYLIRYPFANRLFPGSIDAVEHAQRSGPSVIVSDGDVVFQPHKVYRSGLFEIFEGKVLIYVHKEAELEHIERLYPAEHYVMVDDKLRILAAIKNIWKTRVTTVFVRQGHYAHDRRILERYPQADVSIDRIGDFPRFDLTSHPLRPRASRARNSGTTRT